VNQVSKKKWALIIVMVLIVSLAVPVLFVFRDQGIFFRFSNPAEDYAREKNLPAYLIDKLKPLGYDYYVEPCEKALIDDLSQFGEYASSLSVRAAIYAVMKDGKVTWDEVTTVLEWDTDQDYISDFLEVTKYHTDCTKIDSDGGGIDDFNEIYTYKMNPNDPKDDVAFMKKYLMW
jgi:hypothetical protein